MRIRVVILFLITIWMTQKIDSLYLNLDSTESKLEIGCMEHNKNISFDKLKTERDRKTGNFNKLNVYNCEPVSYAKLFDALNKTQIGKPKFLYLNEIENLTPEHLSGIDKIGIEMLSIKMFKQLKPLHSDLFSTIPTLSKLVLALKDVFKPIPDLSKLSNLQTFNLSISFNPEGQEHGKFLEEKI